MRLKVDRCRNCDCSGKRPIVNVKYYLCEQKNWERLHPGENWFLRRKSLIKKTKPKIKSIKQKMSELKINEAYEILAKTREHVCSGCGTHFGLTRSHIIPRSRRKDLESSLDNILYDCIDCHRIWEHGTLEEKKMLKNYEQRMSYIKRTDKIYYNLLMIKNGSNS